MINKFVFNETSYLGWGARKNLIDEIKRRNFKKALLVTGKEILNLGITNMVTSMLDENKISYEVFSDITTNPSVSNIKKGLRIANKYHVDFIIAVGGGSVIDAAKAIGLVFTNSTFKEVVNINDDVQSLNKSLPVIALPTTTGTASEVSKNIEISDEENNKIIRFDSNAIPVLSIIDTELVANMPVGILAGTGLEALGHAIECYLNINHNEFSDMFAIKALQLIYNNLEKAIDKDKEALEKVALGQYLAGLGFSNAGLGLGHALAHQLGSMYGETHCKLYAMVLPSVLDLYVEDFQDKYSLMAKSIGLETNDMDKISLAYKFSDSIRDLVWRLGMPQKLRDIKVKEKDIPKIAEEVLKNPYVLGSPKKLDVVDIEKALNLMM